eukprot:2137261-Alexandrium_andersonii.AAC.1
MNAPKVSAPLVGCALGVRAGDKVTEVAGPPRARGSASATNRVGGEAGGRRALPATRDPAGSHVGRAYGGPNRSFTGGPVDGSLGGCSLGVARLGCPGRVQPAARPLGARESRHRGGGSDALAAGRGGPRSRLSPGQWLRGAHGGLKGPPLRPPARLREWRSNDTGKHRRRPRSTGLCRRAEPGVYAW